MHALSICLFSTWSRETQSIPHCPPAMVNRRRRSEKPVPGAAGAAALPCLALPRGRRGPSENAPCAFSDLSNLSYRFLVALPPRMRAQALLLAALALALAATAAAATDRLRLRRARCPPEGFQTLPNFNVTAFIEQRWYSLHQVGLQRHSRAVGTSTRHHPRAQL